VTEGGKGGFAGNHLVRNIHFLGTALEAVAQASRRGGSAPTPRPSKSLDAQATTRYCSGVGSVQWHGASLESFFFLFSRQIDDHQHAEITHAFSVRPDKSIHGLVVDAERDDQTAEESKDRLSARFGVVECFSDFLQP